MDLIEELKEKFHALYKSEHPKSDQDPETEIERWANGLAIEGTASETEETATEISKGIQKWADSSKPKS